jgi:hypothetical protein
MKSPSMRKPVGVKGKTRSLGSSAEMRFSSSDPSLRGSSGGGSCGGFPMNPICYNAYKSYNREIAMRSTHSMVISMRLPAESGKRLKRMANRHGWTPSDASARLVEEGLRRSEFGFIDFRDSAAGRQACLQGSTLAVWEVMLLVRSYKNDVSAVAEHLKWPEGKVQAAVNYAGAFPEEINAAMAENEATDFETLKRMLPQAAEFVPKKAAKNRNAQASSR